MRRHQPRPTKRLLGDFFVPGDTTLGALAEIYGLAIPPEDAGVLLADYFRAKTGRPVQVRDHVTLGGIELIADRIEDGRVATDGLDLIEPDVQDEAPRNLFERLRAAV
jgi:cell volume regulation protein A